MRYAAYELTIDVTNEIIVFYRKCTEGLEPFLIKDTLPSCKKFARKGNFTRTDDRVVGNILERYMDAPELENYL